MASRGWIPCTLAALAACSDPPRDACEGVTAAALTAPDRKLIGAASPYPADGMLRGRDAELAGSQRERRAAAWAAVERVLAPVPFAVDPPADVPAELPRWHTWYGKDDLHRLFQRLFRGLSADDMRARTPFTDAALDEAFAWNPRAVEELASWPEDRWREYVAAIDGADDVAGIGGIDRVQYSPGAARHLLASYPAIVGCEGAATPPPVTDRPSAGPRRMVREVMDLAACDERGYGPYFVGDGETLVATADGPAELRVRAGAAPVGDRFDCAGARCEARGPAAVWIAVIAADAGAVTLTVDYQEADPTWAACLASPFPLDAAVIKADWRRAELGVTMPVTATSAAALTGVLGAAEPTWATTASADPGPEQAYTLALPSGNRYRLAALHLMTKELDHWLWITLWWAPDPDDDFGADRPASLAAAGPWRNYKMCVVTAFAEGDPDPRGGVAPAGLAAALAAAHGGGPSWCSNPNLEAGDGNAATNCVGCHQHGGTTVAQETILADETAFPGNGRIQIRNNFPSDYAWAVSQGDRLGRMFADEVEYWTPPSP
ncbi:MAG TPA: hypothetical protein VM734_32240 [Kofleriaceae bacterium]|nr:hypothetical protein [Kofleriaceae bacterium]